MKDFSKGQSYVDGNIAEVTIPHRRKWWKFWEREQARMERYVCIKDTAAVKKDTAA